MYLFIILLISFLPSSTKAIMGECNPFSDNNCEFIGQDECGEHLFDDIQGNNMKAISNMVMKSTVPKIHGTIANKNDCISKDIKRIAECLFGKIVLYNNKRLYSDMEVAGYMVNDGNLKLRSKIQPVLADLSENIQNVQRKASDEIIALIKEGFKVELTEMIDEINSKIAEIVEMVNNSEPIDKNSVVSIIQGGNDDVVAQIMQQDPLNIQVQTETEPGTQQQQNNKIVADAVIKIMKNITFTNPSNVIGEIRKQFGAYLNALDEKLNDLLTNILNIADRSVKDIIAMINLIIDSKDISLSEQEVSFRSSAKSLISSIFAEDKSVTQRKINDFLNNSTNELINYIFEVLNEFNSQVRKIFKKCKKGENVIIKEVINTCKRELTSNILELIVKPIKLSIR